MKNFAITLTPKSFIYALTALVTLWLAWELRSVILIFFIAFILNAAIRPLIEKLEVNFKLNRGLAITLVYSSFIFVIIMLGFVVVESLVLQIRNFALNIMPELPKILNQISKDFPFLKSFLDLNNISIDLAGATDLAKINSGEVASYLFQTISSIGSQGLALIWRSIGGIFTIFIIIVVSVYMVKSKRNFHDGVWDLFPKRFKLIIKGVLDKIEKSLGAWLLGQLALMAIIGLSSYLLILLPGIFDPTYKLSEFALIIGILAGVLEGLPNIGPTITLVLTVIIALISGGSILVVFYILFSFTLLQQLEALFIVPQIMQKAVDLHPIISILAIIAGFNLGGPLGALLSVPVTGAIQIIILELLGYWRGNFE